MDVRAFGKTAETVNKFFTKGKPIFLEGRLTYDTWTAQDGTKKSRHRVTVENFQFLPNTGGGPGPGPGAGDQGGYSADRGAPQARVDNRVPDDDIPF